MRRLLITSGTIATLSVIATTVFAGNNDRQGSQLKTRQALQQVQVPGGQVTPQQVIVNPGTPHHQGGGVARQVIVDGGCHQSLAYFSPRLGARFLIQPIQVGNFPTVTAARIVSEPAHGSPLDQLGLGIGDVITRLDGVPVTTTGELERHIYDTNVRFVKAGSSTVGQGWTWIDHDRYFHETQYTPYSTCQNSALRP